MWAKNKPDCGAKFKGYPLCEGGCSNNCKHIHWSTLSIQSHTFADKRVRNTTQHTEYKSYIPLYDGHDLIYTFPTLQSLLLAHIVHIAILGR